MRLSPTALAAVILLGLGASLAIFAPPFWVIDWIAPVAAGMGIFFCLLSSFVTPSQTTMTVHRFLPVWLYQLALGFITILVCYFFELQSQASERFPSIESGYFLKIIQQSPFSLGVLPWVLYSVFGIAWHFFSDPTQKSPLFLENISTLRKGKWGAFLFSLLYDVFYIAMMMPFVFVTSLVFTALCETVNSAFGWDSIFHKPIRSIFIGGLLIMVFRKRIKTLLSKTQQWKTPLGKLLGGYALGLSFFFLWLHAASGWLALSADTGIKDISPILQSFNAKTISTRLHYLILGWWFVWLPWMASVVAKATEGRAPFRVLIQTLVIPVGVFLFLLPMLTETHYGQLKLWLSQPLGLSVSACGLIFFMQTAWGRMKRLDDVFWGAMPPLQKLTHRPLSRWVDMLFLWLMCYPICWFVSGWLSMQLIVSLGIFFIGIVCFIYLSTWGAFLFRRVVLKRCKALQ